MSVGPVGPGGGVYSIVEVVVSNQSIYMSVVKKKLRIDSCLLQAQQNVILWQYSIKLSGGKN